MRKQVATLLTVVFVFSLSLTANAAVKPGTSCKKLGQTNITSGKKYTCVKSGKNLVWSKGVIAFKVNSTPSQYPVPSTSPTPTISPTPAPTITKILSPSDLKIKAYLEEAKKSYENWREHLPTQKASNLDIKYFYTESFPTYFLNEFKSEAESTVNFYSQFIDSNQIFNIYFLTEKDEAFMDQIGLWTNPENRPTQFKAWRLGQRLNSCEGAAAWFTNSKNDSPPSLHGGIAIASSAPSSNFYLPCLRTLSHEMFHAVQDYWLSNKKGTRSGFASNQEYDRVEMPIFREGSAEYVSGMVATTKFSDYEDSFKARFKDQANGMKAYIDFYSSESVITYLKKIEFKENIQNAHDDSYLLGNLFFEYLVSQYGFYKYIELLKSHNRDIAFRDVFFKVYGFSIDQAYADASTHIINGLTFLIS